MREGVGPVVVRSVGDCVAATLLWRTHGQLRLTIVVKATFVVVHRAPMRLAEPEQLVHDDEHVHGQAWSSVVRPGDLLPYLPRADFLVRGHACAPKGHSVQALATRIAIAGENRPFFSKLLYVYGDRVAVAQGGPAPPPTPFSRIPIVYERAHRGSGFDANPAGLEVRAGSPLPNVIDPDDPVGPAGYGPIGARWPVRARLLRDGHQSVCQGAITEIPDAFAWSYFNAAPPDQRVPYFRGDEWFALDNFHPEVARLESQLPSVRAQARIFGVPDAGPFVGLDLIADRVLIDADAGKCEVSFRANVLVESEVLLPRLRVLAGVELEGDALRWPTIFDDSMPGYAAATVPDETLKRSPATQTLDDEAEASERFPTLVGVRVPELAAPLSLWSPASITPLSAPSTAQVSGADASQRVARDGPAMGPPSVHFMAGARPQTIDDPPTAVQHDEELAELLARNRADDDEPPPTVAPMRRAGVRIEVERRLESGADLAGLDLSGGDLTGLDLSGRSLAGADLRRACLRGAKLSDATLTRAKCSFADFGEADLERTNLEGADFYGATLTGARLAGAAVSDANFSTATGQGACFDAARGARALFGGARWVAASFVRAVLPDADFTEALLDGARFDDAELEGVRFCEARGQAASLQRATLSRARLDGAQLEGGHFDHVYAPGSAWDEACLDGASFRGAMLPEASFAKASCRNADFTGAELASARLERAKFEGARLAHADVGGTMLEAELSRAEVHGLNAAPGSHDEARSDDANGD